MLKSQGVLAEPVKLLQNDEILFPNGLGGALEAFRDTLEYQGRPSDPFGTPLGPFWCHCGLLWGVQKRDGDLFGAWWGPTCVSLVLRWRPFGLSVARWRSHFGYIFIFL